jgi:hypothetical protein
MSMRKPLLLLAALASLSFSAMALAASTQLPTLLTVGDGNSFAVRPLTIGYTGDGTGVIGKLGPKRRGRWHWQSWTGSSAFGTGTVWLDDCVPDCARGTYHSHNGSVLANRVRNGHFTRMKIQFRFRGHTAMDIRRLDRLGSGYVWNIVSQKGF